MEDQAIQLHPAVTLVPMSDAKFQIRSPRQNTTIEDVDGALFGLLSLFREGNSPNALHDLPEALGEAAEWIDYFRNRGILVEDYPATPDITIDQIDFLSVAGKVHERRNKATDLTASAFAVIGNGQVAERTRSILKELGLAARLVVDPMNYVPTGTNEIIVACTDSDDQIFLRNANKVAVASDRPATFSCFTDFSIRLGPNVVPMQSCCFECSYLRANAARQFPAEHDAWLTHNAKNGDRTKRLALTAPLAAHLTALQCIKLTMSDELAEFGFVTEFDLLNLRTDKARVLRLPHCPVCN